jgi:hypothetical protein
MDRKFFGASREDAQAKVADRSKSGAVMSAASAAVRRDPSSTGAWDPYEVWLTRVKQPRDRAAARSARYPSGKLSQQPDLETPARIHRAAEHPV